MKEQCPMPPMPETVSDGSTRTPAFDSFMASVIPDSEIRKRFLADLGAKRLSGQSFPQK